MNNVVRMSSRVGLRNPMYCTAVGKSILARLPEDEIKRIWKASEITPFTPKTITTYERMLDELTTVREKGYAIDDEEHEIGVRCIGVAILDYSGFPIGAISVAAPTARLDDAKLANTIPYIMDAARNISSLLGCNSV